MPANAIEPCPACGAMLDVTGAQIFAERTCPVCTTSIHVHRKFGHYELMEVVGSGGQGLVFKALDSNLNRMVALKLLRTEYSEDPEFVNQFESEAHVTASINHPNVVRVFSFGADEGHVYLAMELVANGTLDDLMEKIGRIPEARALQIGIQIAQGLKAGHEKGLVHRDVKPGNILFGEDGSAKIVDFGLAMFLEQAASSGEIWGTPYYLSPERLHRAQEDFRSDIYSLGATLFHAIAGRPPFEAEDATGVALKHIRANAPSIQSWAPDVTNSTAFVINRTLSKSPEDRYASYDEFIEQLQFARDQALSKAGKDPASDKSRVVLEDAGSRKANSLITIATLLILLTGIAVSAWILTKTKDKDPEVVTDFSGLDGFGPGWGAARDTLAAGNSAQAIEEFRALAQSSDKGNRAWAVIFQALAHQLSGNPQAAAAALAKLETDTPHGKFYSEFAATLSSPASAASAQKVERTNYESLAALFLGIKAYDAGDVETAPLLFRQFTTSNHAREYAFLSEFKKIARPFEDEFTTFGMLTSSLKSAKTFTERQVALSNLKSFQSNLRANSRMTAKVKEAIASMEKLVLQEAEQRRKSNFAAGATITASAWNQEKGDKPEQAADGKPETRWSAGGTTPKWIQFDFGVTKAVGRWALYLNPPIQKNIHRLRDFALEYSDDGKAWSKADSVFGNRAEIVDRLIPPFKARFTRITVARGSWDPKDNSARIYEAEFSDAGEQVKANYGPAESSAIRFSPESALSLIPIGPITITGKAVFDAKNGRYTIRGSGDDIWGTQDSFHFVYEPVEGDFEVIARVTKVEGPHVWSKAGIMVRTDFTRDSSHAMMAAGPGEKAQFVSRKEAGKPSVATTLEKRKLPVWFKLARTGPTISGFESSDGQVWTKVSQETPAGLGPIAAVGLFSCAHQQGALGTGEFDNVSIKPSR